MDFLKVLAVVVTAVVTAIAAIFKLRDVFGRAWKRSGLKADLEIYRLLEPSDPNLEVVKTSIDASIQRLYGPGTNRKVSDWTSLVVGCVFTVAFAAWTAYLLRDGFTWWAIPTVFFVIVGLTSFAQAFQPKDDHQVDGR
jgi:hypothetical protein